jgi:hypothetical protein
MKDGKSDADFGSDDDARIVRLLAAALFIAESKAAAVKKQREDAEKQLQEWDDGDVTTKAAASGGGGGGGGGKKGKGQGNNKRKNKPPVKQPEKSAAADASSPTTLLPDSVSAADGNASSSSSSTSTSTSTRRLPTADEADEDSVQQVMLLSITEHRDKALKTLSALCAQLSTVDPQFAATESDDAMTGRSAALTAAVDRVEKQRAQQTARHKAELAAVQRKYDDGPGVLAEAGRMELEAAFKDVGPDGRDADGNVTIAGAKAYEAACDAALDARENANKEAAMADARALADARGDEYTLSCDDADAISSQAASDDKHDMNLDSMAMSEVLVLMAAQCGNLAAYCETQPWNETAGSKTLGAADAIYFPPEFIAEMTLQITAAASPPPTIVASVAPLPVTAAYPMWNEGIGGAVVASADATTAPSTSMFTPSGHNAFTTATAPLVYAPLDTNALAAASPLVYAPSANSAFAASSMWNDFTGGPFPSSASSDALYAPPAHAFSSYAPPANIATSFLDVASASPFEAMLLATPAQSLVASRIRIAKEE